MRRIIRTLAVIALVAAPVAINMSPVDLHENGIYMSGFNINNKLRFNRFLKLDGDKQSAFYYENGYIEIYGDVVVLHKTSTQDVFHIKSSEYNDLEDVYTYKANRADISYNVVEKTITFLYPESNTGEIYYL